MPPEVESKAVQGNVAQTSQLHPKIEVARAQIESLSADQRRIRELGRIGIYLGSKEQVATYFAILLALFFGAVIIVLMFVPIAPGIERKDAIQTMITLFSSALAYVFGSASSKNPER
jgi:hypothetical protein